MITSAWRPLAPDIDAFLSQYESRFAHPGVGEPFADEFLVVDPNRVLVFSRPMFVESLPARRGLFERAGVGDVRRIGAAQLDLDPLHLLLSVDWSAERASRDSVHMEATFLLRREDAGPRVLVYLNHGDIVALLVGGSVPLALAEHSMQAEWVDALFYNFAPGEVARHIPRVWRTTTPEAAIAARQIGCANALRRILGDHIDTPAFGRAAELLIKAATGAPLVGRPMYAALRTIPVPDDVVARLFHAASLVREHRGDGHIAALMVEGVGGLEAHVLFALVMDMPAERFGRIHHLPAPQLRAVIDGMRDRGLIGDDGWLSDQGRAAKQRVESLTDDLPGKPYESLDSGELDELMAELEPLATMLLAAQNWG